MTGSGVGHRFHDRSLTAGILLSNRATDVQGIGCLAREINRLAGVGRTNVVTGTWVLIGPALGLLLVGRGIIVQVPRVVHHHSEVFLVIDVGTDVVVIFNPFVKSDFAVILAAVTQVLLSLKGLEPVVEGLFLSFNATQNCR